MRLLRGISVHNCVSAFAALAKISDRCLAREQKSLAGDIRIP